MTKIKSQWEQDAQAALAAGFPVQHLPDSRQVLDGLRRDPKTRKYTRHMTAASKDERDAAGTCFLLDPRWDG